MECKKEEQSNLSWTTEEQTRISVPSDTIINGPFLILLFITCLCPTHSFARSL